MIISFRHKGLELFFRTGSTKGIRAEHAEKLRQILMVLERIKEPGEIGYPGWRLHPLYRNLTGHWSVWVSGSWRVTFRFIGTDVELVDYQNYH